MSGRHSPDEAMTECTKLMNTTSRFSIRDARADERAAIQELTLAAYAELATIMAPTAWAALRQALQVGLEAEGAVERIVAEQDGELVGSVLLYSPTANAYGNAVAGAGWPELRLLAVAPAARGQGVGTGRGMHAAGAARRGERTGAAHIGKLAARHSYVRAHGLCARARGRFPPY